MWNVNIDVVIFQRTSRGLRSSAVNKSCTAPILQLLHYLSALTVALLATMGTLLRCQGDPTSFLLCVYQNVEPRSKLCACSKYASQNSVHFDSAASNEDAMVLHQCRKLYCVHLGVLHFQERSKIALRTGSPGVTGVI